ncbi:MAG: hypothetical protein P8K79_12740 [Mariniblastus sp.]|nr:hypothetical protein [Mariniblastus sp.]
MSLACSLVWDKPNDLFSFDATVLGQVVDAGVINTSTASAVPLPAAWLLISAMAGLAGAKRSLRSKDTA